MRTSRTARGVTACLAVIALAAGCSSSGGKDDEDGSGGGGGGKGVNTPRLKIAMVTHSDEGSFWTVVKKGAEQAAKDEGVKLIWSPANNDPQKEAQLIEAAVSQIERDFGAGSLMRLGDKGTIKVASIPTGSLALDLALGIGGVPRGRFLTREDT